MNHDSTPRGTASRVSATHSISLLLVATFAFIAPVAGGCDLSGCLVTIPDGDNDPGAPTGPEWRGEYETGFTVDIAHDDQVGHVSLAIWYPVNLGAGAGHRRALYALGEGPGQLSELAYRDAPVSDSAPNTLIVYSHGAGSFNVENFPIMESLASHGFVVAAPIHSGWLADLSSTFSQEAQARVPEASAVIDHMMERANSRYDRFYQRIAEGQVGVFGYSRGATTAIGTLVGWAGASRDPRVSAVAAVALPMYGDTALPLPLERFSSVSAPVLLLGGSLDDVADPADQDLAYHELTGSSAVYDAVVEGANHFSFIKPLCLVGLLDRLGLGFLDPSGDSPGIAAACSRDAPIDIHVVERLQQTYLVAFARRHLRGELEYEAYLTRTRPSVRLRVRTR